MSQLDWIAERSPRAELRAELLQALHCGDGHEARHFSQERPPWLLLCQKMIYIQTAMIEVIIDALTLDAYNCAFISAAYLTAAFARWQAANMSNNTKIN